MEHKLITVCVRKDHPTRGKAPIFNGTLVPALTGQTGTIKFHGGKTPLLKKILNLSWLGARKGLEIGIPLGDPTNLLPQPTNLGGVLWTPHGLPKALCTTLVSSRVRRKGTGYFYVGTSP